MFVEGLIYHVYNRVGRGEAPFTLEDEAEQFWSLLHDVKQRDGLSILAWCIMPSHYHLVLRTGTVPLWRSMRHLQHRYAQAFNRRCRVFGPLWQARYKARPIEAQNSLLRAIAYVHLNPVAAGLATDPGAYRWSGHPDLLDRARRPLVDRDLVFTLLGGTRGQALRPYQDIIRREPGEQWIAARLEMLPWWRSEPEQEAQSKGLDPLGRSAGTPTGGGFRRSTSSRASVRCSGWMSATWRAPGGVPTSSRRAISSGRLASSGGASASRRWPIPWGRAETALACGCVGRRNAGSRTPTSATASTSSTILWPRRSA